jgi:hypothetical protein
LFYPWVVKERLEKLDFIGRYDNIDFKEAIIKSTARSNQFFIKQNSH